MNEHYNIMVQINPDRSSDELQKCYETLFVVMIPIKVYIGPTLRLMTKQLACRLLIDILIENCLRYSACRGKVKIIFLKL